MNRSRRIQAGVMCGLFVALLLASGVLVTTHLFHDCTGEGCLVCAAITGWHRLLRGMALAAALSGASQPALRAAVASLRERMNGAAARTLVSLKVKLSD